MKSLIAAAMVAAALAVVPAPAQAEGADMPARILIVGDSITQGRPGDHTWRYYAWQSLAEAATPVDFVGPRRGVFRAGNDQVPYSWDYTGDDAYADPHFDQDHGAWWGQALTSSTREPLTDLMKTYVPDVVVSNFGINDVSTISAADLTAAYRSWIGEARSVNPDVDLVIGKVPHTWAYDGRPAAFNVMIVDLASELSTDRSRVEVFDVQDFTTSDTWDGTHLVGTGERKYARAVTVSLARLGYTVAPIPEPAVEDPTTPGGPVTPPLAPPLTPTGVEPEPVGVAAPVTPPLTASSEVARPRAVKAVRHGSRVVVRWRAAVEAIAYRVRCGQAAKTVNGSKALVRSAATSCRVRARSSAGVSSWAKVRVRPAG